MPVKNDAFRRERAHELQQMYQVLANAGLSDVGGLSKAGNECATNKPNGDDNCWGYYLEPTVFDVKNEPKVFPGTAVGLKSQVSLEIVGRCSTSEDEPDPFLALGMEMTVIGYLPDGKSKPRKLTFYWHLDRDIGKSGDGRQEEYHPLYHFQHGGNRIPSSGYSIGDTLFMDPPRLLHPPMDAILAVDFVLANFCTAMWYDLSENVPEYRKLIGSAQQRCWQPFFETIAKHWALGPAYAPSLKLSPCLVPKKV